MDAVETVETVGEVALDGEVIIGTVTGVETGAGAAEKHFLLKSDELSISFELLILLLVQSTL